jgi:phenylacetate-CoA ligase
VHEFRLLDQSQWKSQAELEELQIQRLRSLLIHAGEHVPYYRQLFAEAAFNPEHVKDVDTLKSLPVLSKQIIREQSTKLLADNAAQYQPRPHRSAGTTGQPIILQMDRKRHSVAWADMYRWWSAGGWQLGEKQFVIAGAALRPRQLSGMKAKLYSRLNNFEDISSFNLTERSLDQFLLRLEKHRGPVYLRGYASSMHVLARHAYERQWSGSVKAVFTTAETLFPEQRTQIEKALRTHVFDQWGCRDGGISAFECDQHHGLHLAIENAVVEICRDGQPVPHGESGLVVATDLFSYAMPIIRYEVGDVATYATSPCACGRGLPLIASVQGRVSGFLVGSGGRRIHGEFFSHIFWEAPWVKEFQIVQDKPEEIIVNVIKATDPPPGQLVELSQLMEEYAGPECRVRVEFVDTIPPGPMGKRQFIICRIPS